MSDIVIPVDPSTITVVALKEGKKLSPDELFSIRTQWNMAIQNHQSIFVNTDMFEVIKGQCRLDLGPEEEAMRDKIVKLAVEFIKERDRTELRTAVSPLQLAAHHLSTAVHEMIGYQTMKS